MAIVINGTGTVTGISVGGLPDAIVDLDTLAADSVNAAKIVDGTIVVGDIADDAVTAAKLANSINTDIATGVTAGTTASAALPKAGGTMTGAVTGSTLTAGSQTGNVTLDFGTYTNFVLTLTGAVTLVNPTTEVAGQSGFITFIQDGTGGRVVSTSATDYETVGGSGITLSTTASASDVVPYIVAASGRILLGAPQLAFA